MSHMESVSRHGHRLSSSYSPSTHTSWPPPSTPQYQRLTSQQSDFEQNLNWWMLFLKTVAPRLHFKEKSGALFMTPRRNGQDEGMSLPTTSCTSVGWRGRGRKKCSLVVRKTLVNAHDYTLTIFLRFNSRSMPCAQNCLNSGRNLRRKVDPLEASTGWNTWPT